MQVYVRLAEADMDAICELREWLQENQSVRQYGRLRWAAAPRGVATTAEIALGLEALQLVVGAGLSLVQLAVMIGQWRQAQPTEPKVLIATCSPEGTAVSIESADPAVVRAAVRVLEER